MMFEAKYNLFGASVDDVLGYLPGAGFRDVATVRRQIQQDSTDTTIIVDSTVGLQSGDYVHAPISEHDEVREIDEIVSATSFSVTQAFSEAPDAGDTVDNGPECIRRELVRAEGEVIVDSAEEAQDSAALGLATASNVKLYKNFAGMLNELGPEDELADTAWSLDGQDVTFDPALVEGDRVLASYDVTIATICILRTLLTDLATFRVGRSLIAQFDRVTPEWLLSFRDRGEKTLEEIFSTGRGIGELDALRLYEDWERPGRGIRCGVVEKN